MKTYETLLSEDDIKAIVKTLADEITREYKYKCPIMIGVLTGALIFMSDLVRHFEFPLEIDFIRASSYEGMRSTNELKIISDVQADLTGRDVLLIEDIVDTGLTANLILKHISKKGASSVRLCSLLDKPSQRIHLVEINFVGRIIPDRFVVGYGLDYEGLYRNLPYISLATERSRDLD